MSPRKRDIEAGLHDQTNLLPRGQRFTVFFVLAGSLFVAFVDQNGIGILLPAIGRDLNATATISWAGTSALIANTVFQVLYGRLSDLFGRKLVYLSALALLSFSDLMCGLSQNATMLYVFRGLAGVAGGGITSLTMMIVSDIVTLEQRGKYQGILGSMLGLGNLAGPLIAAAFEQRATWRALFYLLAPTAAICAVVSAILLPSSIPSKDFKGNLNKIDYLGVFTATVALILLLIPVSGGGSYFEWSSPMVIAMLTVGGVFAVLFILVEWKVAALPMMPLGLFRNVPVGIMIGQNFFYGMVYYGFMYYLPLYYINVRQYSTIVSALLIIPLVLSQSSFSILSGQYISRTKRYGEVIWAGFILWTVGAFLTYLFNRTIPPVGIIFILIVIGTGIGFVFQPTLVAMQAHCPKSQRAIVISNRNFIRALGGAVGLAVCAAVLQNALKRSLPPQFKHLAASTYSSPDYADYSPADADAIKDAYAAASHTVFMMFGPFMAFCLAGCFFVKDRGLTRPDEKVPGTPAEPVQTPIETSSVDPEKHSSEIATPASAAAHDGEAAAIDTEPKEEPGTGRQP